MSSDGQAGPYTDWVVACAPGRSRCPSLFLASWGYQCSTLDGASCCLQPNGKFCARMEGWGDTEAPPSWRGRDNITATTDARAGGSSPADGQQIGGKDSSVVWGQSLSKSDKQEEEEKDFKPWRKATATYFNAYPACCTNDEADSTECDDYSGCEWAGQFAGVSGKKSRSWVREHNIVALFEAGRSKVLDTCADDDCEGCCTSNARKNGGFLIDLEATTAERFWEGEVQGLAAIQWQVV
ncbi:hypothetical protein C2E21_4319 [Chlorella sorokiniana]|uniref:Uncharacterized protein n=1 Tax=Chlorella sorokiniana TaxID=3076 RepID=A0A2P6TSJ1_CHLSO|nr:hypothetical protein C2E21_4319 [Chlorella sorokiniana]|eukprot:PRW57035.1 hypothetical protein C2E21_4319 [Chlorella sorokiniana]